MEVVDEDTIISHRRGGPEKHETGTKSQVSTPQLDSSVHVPQDASGESSCIITQCSSDKQGFRSEEAESSLGNEAETTPEVDARAESGKTEFNAQAIDEDRPRCSSGEANQIVTAKGEDVVSQKDGTGESDSTTKEPTNLNLNNGPKQDQKSKVPNMRTDDNVEKNSKQSHFSSSGQQNFEKKERLHSEKSDTQNDLISSAGFCASNQQVSFANVRQYPEMLSQNQDDFCSNSNKRNENWDPPASEMSKLEGKCCQSWKDNASNRSIYANENEDYRGSKENNSETAVQSSAQSHSPHPSFPTEMNSEPHVQSEIEGYQVIKERDVPMTNESFTQSTSRLVPTTREHTERTMSRENNLELEESLRNAPHFRTKPQDDRNKHIDFRGKQNYLSGSNHGNNQQVSFPHDGQSCERLPQFQHDILYSNPNKDYGNWDSSAREVESGGCWEKNRNNENLQTRQFENSNAFRENNSIETFSSMPHLHGHKYSTWGATGSGGEHTRIYYNAGFSPGAHHGYNQAQIDAYNRNYQYQHLTHQPPYYATPLPYYEMTLQRNSHKMYDETSNRSPLSQFEGGNYNSGAMFREPCAAQNILRESDGNLRSNGRQPMHISGYPQHLQNDPLTGPHQDKMNLERSTVSLARHNEHHYPADEHFWHPSSQFMLASGNDQTEQWTAHHSQSHERAKHMQPDQSGSSFAHKTNAQYQSEYEHGYDRSKSSSAHDFNVGPTMHAENSSGPKREIAGKQNIIDRSQKNLPNKEWTRVESTHEKNLQTRGTTVPTTSNLLLLVKNEYLKNRACMNNNQACIELNAIFGDDILKSGIEGVNISVYSEGKFFDGFIVAADNEQLWMRFFLPSINGTIHYTYEIVTMNFQKKHETYSEQTPSNCGRFRWVYFPDGNASEQVKYDGKIVFSSIDDGKWMEKIKSFVPGLRGKSIPIQSFHKLQVSEGFPFYLSANLDRFLSSRNLRNWVHNFGWGLRSVNSHGWRMKNDEFFPTELKLEDFSEFLINKIINLYESRIKDGKDNLEVFLMKLAFASIIYKYENFWLHLGNSCSEKLCKVINLSDISDKNELLSVLGERYANELSGDFEWHCGRLFRLHPHSSIIECPLFFALIEWACLNGSDKFLVSFESSLKLSESSFQYLAQFASTNASSKHLLLIGVISDIGIPTIKEIQAPSLPIIVDCLSEYCDKFGKLSTLLIKLLESEITCQKLSPVVIEKSLWTVLSIFRIMLRTSFRMENASDAYVLLCFSLNLLEGFDKINKDIPETSGTSRKLILPSDYCPSFFEVASKIINEHPLTVADLRCWAILISDRKDFSTESRGFVINFLPSVIRSSLTKLSLEVISDYCDKLNNLSRDHYQTGIAFENLQNVLNKISMELLGQEIDAGNFCHQGILMKLLVKRSNLDSFIKIIFQKVIELTKGTTPFQAVANLVQFHPLVFLMQRIHELPMNSESLRELGDRLREHFKPVLCCIDEGNLTAKENEHLCGMEQTFFETCNALNLTDQQTAEIFLRKNQSIMEFTAKKIHETENFLELMRQLASSTSVKIELSALDDLVRNWESTKFNELVAYDPNELVFIKGSLAENDIALVQKFQRLLQSRVFSKLAETILKQKFQVSEQSSFPYQDVLREILPEAEQKYLENADSVISGNIAVREIKQIFDEQLDDDSINNEMLFFAEALDQRCSKLKNDEKFEKDVRIRQEQLRALRKLNTNVTHVRILKSLCEMLGNEASKKKLEILINLDNLEQTEVRYLSEDLLDYENTLPNPTKAQMEALRIFVKRPSFLQWIKENVGTLKELHQLASLCAGEDPVEINRIKCFHDAVYGYSSLIYDLKPESNFDDLKRSCDEVFKKLSLDPGMPQKYSDSARNQNWFEKFREARGSLKKNSLETAKSINDSGVYRIAYLSNDESNFLLSSEDVVNLRYKEDSSNQNSSSGQSNSLSLSELRDLLSRLMLILDHEKHEQVQNVNRFTATFEYIERLSAAFVTLYNSGCSFFLGWWCCIRINPGKSEPALEAHFGGALKPLHSFTKDIDNCLAEVCSRLELMTTKWSEYVFQMRLRHPILNRFNIQQLTTMSLQITEFKKLRESFPYTTLYLLQSLKPTLDTTQLQTILDQNGKKTRVEDNETSDTTSDGQPDRFANVEKLTEEVCEDQQSRLISLVDFVKSHYGDNDKLARAALQATECKSEDEAVNWIMENNAEDEADDENQRMIEKLAQDFDVYFDSVGSRDHASEFADRLTTLFDAFLESLNSNLLSDFLNLHQLALLLEQCSENGNKQSPAPDFLRLGVPNLVVCAARGDILPQIISYYRCSSRTCLPDYFQVLFCSDRTTVQELEVFILRATLDPQCQLYTIAHADELSASCAEHFERLFFDRRIASDKQYKLVVFSCNENSQISVILEKFKRFSSIDSYADLQLYLSENLRVDASDLETYRTKLVTSVQPSSGKSWHIQKLASRLVDDRQPSYHVFRIHENKVNFEKCMDFLWNLRANEGPTILHFDLSANVHRNVDELIFKLCILGGLQDERGKLFLTRKNFVTIIELLQPQKGALWAPLCQLLPSTKCYSPNQCLDIQEPVEPTNCVRADDELLADEVFQRPCSYIVKTNQGEDVSNYVFANDSKAEPKDVIRILKTASSLKNPTWAQISGFARFLNNQLVACEENVFCSVLPGFKNFLIKHCLIDMARDFALPSLNISDDSPMFGLEKESANFNVHQLRRKWENQPHPYVFFNADESTFTFLGFIVNNTNLLDSNGKILARNVMPKDLEDIIRTQAYSEKNILGEKFDELTDVEKLTKLCRVLGVDVETAARSVDSNYELTQDNVMKLLAIHLRFLCDIPVIIMGETGCGKTKLIEYLCMLIAGGRRIENKKIVKVHGGVTDQDIFRNVAEAEELARLNSAAFGPNCYTVLFFDEANTTEAIYAIKEVVCDFSVRGRKLDRNTGLKVIAACNPYRKHDTKTIESLENQGLGYYVKSDDIEDRLDSDIPMRHLVYRVVPLPPSLLPLVWDFGQLTTEVETKYLKQIITRQSTNFGFSDNDTNFLCNVLSASQKFMRERKDRLLFVSLRDIERAVRVFEFFHSRKELILSEIDEEQDRQRIESASKIKSNLARLVILTLGVCYHSSVEDREAYRLAIEPAFKDEYALPNGQKSIWSELDTCQRVFLRNLSFDKNTNIAKNLALSENVFMMIVCIELRIPLFLVGKPGSSKSLAKTIVLDSMHGDSSRNDFFMQLKEVQMLSFQCSPHTNPEGIISTFRQAALFQKGKDLEKFACVVVFDEIGLAEDSPKMPLKALHPLLEEGYIERGESQNEHGKVCFIGISNWALDPAKINRGVLLNRTVPTTDELIKSAKGICRVTEEGKPLEKLIDPLSKAYEEVYKQQVSGEYFGLRDFYGLMKKLHQEFIHKRGESELGWTDTENAIRRNFGGKKDDTAMPIFVKHLKRLWKHCKPIPHAGPSDTLRLVEQNVKEIEKRASLPDEQRFIVNESRYLLLMTENFSALQLLPQVLNLENSEVVFGSSFPQDQEYIQVCKYINRIKVCMEMGTIVVLINLRPLYESLYDALNQYYTFYGGKRFVDLGLGANRVQCSVSENFRLILIEEEKVARNFPIPLLNRLEKHILGIKSLLSPELTEVASRLLDTIAKLANVPRKDCEDKQFELHDSFIGYQEDDTIACVVVQTKKWAEEKNCEDEHTIFQKSLERLFQIFTKEAIDRAYSKGGKFVECAQELYESEGRRNLSEFLWKQFYSRNTKVDHQFTEVTTFSRLPSNNAIKIIIEELVERKGYSTDEKTIQQSHFVANLTVFKSETEFVENISKFLQKTKTSDSEKVIFVTCPKNQEYASLIAGAKYSIQKLCKKFQGSCLLIVFIIELPRTWNKTDYGSFSVGQWSNFHIDKLVVEEDFQPLVEMIENEASSLRDLVTLNSSGECSKFQRRVLREVVCEAVADANTPGSDNKLLKINNVYKLFEEENLEVIFFRKFAAFIQNESKYDKKLKSWVAEESSNLRNFIQNGDIEHTILQELKQTLKPHVAEFLHTLDFNNNIRLLFKDNWRKTLWMGLFNLPEISQARKLKTVQNTFDSDFPFSSEIIAKMETVWNGQLNYFQGREREAFENFISLMEKSDDKIWCKLREIATEDSALDSFLQDLIQETLGQLFRDKQEQAVFIKKTILSRMKMTHSNKQSLAVVFAFFKNLKSEIVVVSPILHLVQMKTSPQPAVGTLTLQVLEMALETQSKEVNYHVQKTPKDDPRPMTRSDIQKCVQNIQQLAKLSFEEPSQCTINRNANVSDKKDAKVEEIHLQVQKLSIFSIFLGEICHGLDDELTEQAAGGAKMIWTSIRKKEKLSGSKKLFESVSYCLKKSFDDVLNVCIKREVGQVACALCRKSATGKGIIPLVIPCKKRHVIHRHCWKKHMEKIAKYEGEEDMPVEDMFVCFHCNEEISRNVLTSHQVVEFSCRQETNVTCWDHFLENIRRVFINLIRDNFVQNCDADAAKEIIRLCMVYNDEIQDTGPHYITNQSKQALVTMFAEKRLEMLCEVLQELLSTDRDTAAREINCDKTLAVILAAFDCVSSNGETLKLPTNAPRFAQTLCTIVRVKMDLKNFCDQIIKDLDADANYTFTLPRSIQEVFDEGDEKTVDHVRVLFIRTLCLDHGMSHYAKFKQNSSLQMLCPSVLSNSPNERTFTDIFLVIPEYQSTFEHFLKCVTNRSTTTGDISFLSGVDLFLKQLVTYRFLLENCSGQEAMMQSESAQKAIQMGGGNLIEPILNRNHKLSPSKNSTDSLAQHFFFLLQAYCSTRCTQSILEPLMSIALNKTNEEELFLPTFPDSEQRKMKMFDTTVDFTTWNTCPNGHIYTIGDCGRPYASAECLECREPIGGSAMHVFNPNNHLLGRRGETSFEDAQNSIKGTGYVEESINCNSFERSLNGLTGTTMLFFLHAALFLKSGCDAKAEAAKQNVKTLSENCLGNSEDDVWKFLVHVLITSEIRPLQGSFRSEEDREKWETVFAEHITEALKNLDIILPNYEQIFQRDNRNELSSLPTVLFGTPFASLPAPESFDENLMNFEKFWIRTPKVSLVEFQKQINAADKDSFPLLNDLLSKDIVESLIHIPTLLRVFRELVRYFNADETSKSFSIEDFLHEKLPDNVSDKIRDDIMIYIKTWNEKIKHEFNESLTLTFKSPIWHFLPTRNSAALATMNFLISKNNDLIESYRRSCQVESPVLYLEEGAVRDDHVVQVEELKKELLPIVVTFTTQNFESATPRVVHDFAAIQRAIGSRLCGYKPLIKMTVMPMMSNSPSNKTALNNARPHLEEKPLNKLETEKLAERFTSIPDVCLALRQLILLMKYLERSYASDTSTISEFMDKNLKIQCLQGIGDFELNQTVPLWQHLSLRKTYLLMTDHNEEDPFPEVLPQFKESLEEGHIEELGRIRKEDRKSILILLNEFIVLNLEESEPMKPHYHIEECLDAYFDQETGLKLPEWAHLKYATAIVKYFIESSLP